MSKLDHIKNWMIAAIRPAAPIKYEIITDFLLAFSCKMSTIPFSIIAVRHIVILALNT